MVSYLKKRKKKTRASGRTSKRVRGSCTIPPPPVKNILVVFSLKSNQQTEPFKITWNRKRRGDRVQHAEKVKSERVLANEYDCWDVHTQQAIGTG